MGKSASSEEVFQFVGNTTRPGDHKWDEFVDTRTGQSSLEIHTLKPVTNCADCGHYWEVLDSTGHIHCKYCGLGKTLIWGLDIVSGGKIVRLDSPAPQYE